MYETCQTQQHHKKQGGTRRHVRRHTRLQGGKELRPEGFPICRLSQIDQPLPLESIEHRSDDAYSMIHKRLDIIQRKSSRRPQGIGQEHS